MVSVLVGVLVLVYVAVLRLAGDGCSASVFILGEGSDVGFIRGGGVDCVVQGAWLWVDLEMWWSRFLDGSVAVYGAPNRWRGVPQG